LTTGECNIQMLGPIIPDTIAAVLSGSWAPVVNDCAFTFSASLAENCNPWELQDQLWNVNDMIWNVNYCDTGSTTTTTTSTTTSTTTIPPTTTSTTTSTTTVPPTTTSTTTSTTTVPPTTTTTSTTTSTTTVPPTTTTTTTSTTTSTTTIPPTTTTSTTTSTTTLPYQEYLIDNGANSTSAGACAGSTTRSTVYTNPSNNIPIVGMFFYTDTSLTTPFVGSTGWRKITKDGINYAGEVNSSGELTNYVNC
jgi:hypothetical protein